MRRGGTDANNEAPGRGTRLHRLTRALDLDATIIFGVARMGWMTLTTVVTIAFVARYLSKTEQGYYYAFFSFFQLQLALQAGAYVTLMGAMSHAWAKLVRGADGRPAGHEADLRTFGGLLAWSRSWHLGCGAFFAAVIGPLGHAFFAFGPQSGVAWHLPWWALALSVAASFLILPDQLALEATGQTGEQQRTLFLGQIASSLAGLSTLALGGGLYSVAVMTLIRMIVTGALLARRARPFRGVPAARTDWRRDLLPQQAKVTLSWLLGYAIFAAAAPITFQVAGAAIAGRVGMALQIYQAVNGTASIWITRAQPLMGVLAARFELSQLDKLTASTAMRGTVFAILLAIGALAAIAVVRHLDPAMAARLPHDIAIVGYLAVAVAAQWPSAAAAAVRLMREEPFVPLSALGALTATILYTLGAAAFGEVGVAGGFVIATCALVFPGQMIIYHRRVH